MGGQWKIRVSAPRFCRSRGSKNKRATFTSPNQFNHNDDGDTCGRGRERTLINYLVCKVSGPLNYPPERKSAVENNWVNFRPRISIRSSARVWGRVGSLGTSPDPAPQDPPHASEERPDLRSGAGSMRA